MDDLQGGDPLLYHEKLPKKVMMNSVMKLREETANSEKEGGKEGGGRERHGRRDEGKEGENEKLGLIGISSQVSVYKTKIMYSQNYPKSHKHPLTHQKTEK